MNFKLTFFSIAIVLLSACDHPKQESKTSQPVAQTNITTCYRYIHNRDTVLLNTIYTNGLVTGTLLYNFYEKDKNQGTIKGKITGDTIFADYTFQSEGVKSVRQVAFKKVGENLMEGYGETENSNGKTVFKNMDSLSFTHSIELKPYNCK